MVSTVHLAVGVCLATRTRMWWPFLFISAYLYHLIFDSMPHWDLIMPPYTSTLLWAWLDMLFGWFLVLLFVWFCARRQWFRIIFAAGFSILPDVIQFATFYWLPPVDYLAVMYQFHMMIQPATPLVFGVFVQVMIVLAMYGLSLRGALRSE